MGICAVRRATLNPVLSSEDHGKIVFFIKLNGRDIYANIYRHVITCLLHKSNGLAAWGLIFVFKWDAPKAKGILESIFLQPP